MDERSSGGGVWTPPTVAVWSASQENRVEAQAANLAASLGLSLIADPRQADDLLLVVAARGLELRDCGQPQGGTVAVDFINPARWHLRHWNGLFRQPLAKAVGAGAFSSPLVWDVTAGLGRDAWLLACMGCRVIAIERFPILGAMLQDAAGRAARVEDLSFIVPNRLQVVVADARQLLWDVPSEEAPDVVYLDPMFATKKKSALSKKEMRVLRRLVGDDPDSGELLEAATRAAGRRVVVKRLRHAPALGPRPNVKYQGKIVRYDVYFTRNVVKLPSLGYGDDEDEGFWETTDEPPPMPWMADDPGPIPL